MSEHSFPEGQEHCTHCGTWKGNPQRTICPGGHVPASELRPEPARREFAADDADAIHARLAELKAERAAAANTIEDQIGDVQ